MDKFIPRNLYKLYLMVKAKSQPLVMWCSMHEEETLQTTRLTVQGGEGARREVRVLYLNAAGRLPVLGTVMGYTSAIATPRASSEETLRNNMLK